MDLRVQEMPEQPTSRDRKLHLYLVFDDWNSGYSVRKVSLSRRSGKRRSESSDDSSGEDDSEQPAALSVKGAKPLPVFMRVSAQRGFPEFFTSAFGTKIMVIDPRQPVDDIFMGIPIIDVADRSCTFERMHNIAGAPIYIPVSDDRLFSLDIGSFRVLRKPERYGEPWVWKKITPRPPFRLWDVSSYGVQPDGCILVSTKAGDTFIFDTKENVWKLYGRWAFPFTGRGHYDPSLKGFVGLSKDPETLGYLYCCTMASTVSGGKVLHPTSPDFKCTKHTVYNENPALGRHVSATLVHMRPGKFCLVECVCIDDSRSTDQELRVGQELREQQRGAHRMDFVGGGPQGGCFMYRLKTFSLCNMKGDLKLKHCKVCCYRLPHEARIGTIRQNPVAFWL